MKVNEIIINWEQQYVWWVDWLCVINVAMWWDGHERKWIVAVWELKDGAICILKWSNLDVYGDYWIDIYDASPSTTPISRDTPETIPLAIWHIDIVRTSSEPRLRAGSSPITWMLKDWGNWKFSFFRRDWWGYTWEPE